MKSSDAEIFLVAGHAGAGPDHWMSRWQTRLKTARLLEAATEPAKIDALVAAVALASRPAVLVAHSSGVATIIHAAPRLKGANVAGAFLVAPVSEATAAGLPGADAAFGRFSRDPLPFPSWLIASRNDIHCSHDEAADLANAWGSKLVDAGDSAHLNEASGHGPWPEGALQFGQFLRQL